MLSLHIISHPTASYDTHYTIFKLREVAEPSALMTSNNNFRR